MTTTRTATRATLGPGDSVARSEFPVAGMNRFAAATRTVAEHRLGQVAGRDVDLLAVVDVGDAAAIHGLGHGFFDLALEAPDKTLAVDRTFVLAIQPAVDKRGHQRSP